ncbi:zinc finger MYM-type protein 5-like [Eutrema salsugineum]|uniref:zinc finger MYM-type protein 5-like n=1 Tax=Eutrema salsugineum TaxID=72664 RepID=UPI000CECF662|nr:zinc finger MYM-type protein 5-like [Eutrema salsugineum]
MTPLGIRKQPSGAEKRKRRKKIQEFVKSQANSMLKFLKKPENSTETIGAQRNNRDDTGQSKVAPENLDGGKENDEEEEVVYQSENKKEHISEDMFDPGNWRNVDTRLRELLVEKGPVARLPSDYQFPKDANGKHFSHACYIRVMANGEKVDRKWLVYSKAMDKVFCFGCKLFIDDDQKNVSHTLVNTGYNDRGNVSTFLKEHERSCDHIRCVTRWALLKISLQKKKEYISEDMSDPGNWRNVDTRLREKLVENGPVAREPSDYQFPKDANGKHFSHACYIRVLANREKLDRRWLVYSKALDKAFCFCCKLFKDEQKNVGGNLATRGYNNWRNVSTRLREHERSHDHMLCMTRWKQLEIRLHKDQIIDKLIKS